MNPSELAVMADAYYTLRQKRLTLSREVEDLKEGEKEMKRVLIKHLTEEGVKVIGGKVCTVKLVPTKEPIVRDWDALWAHIIETGSTELVQKRLGVTAARERFDVGEELPGVEIVDGDALSLTKS